MSCLLVILKTLCFVVSFGLVGEVEQGLIPLGSGQEGSSHEVLGVAVAVGALPMQSPYQDHSYLKLNPPSLASSMNTPGLLAAVVPRAAQPPKQR